jgi:hypothetical protein
VSALEGAPVVARQVLRKLLLSPIVVTPEAAGTWSFAAMGSYDRILYGTVGGEDHGSVAVGRTPNIEDLKEELAALVRPWELAQVQTEPVRAVPPPGSPSSRSWR